MGGINTLDMRGCTVITDARTGILDYEIAAAEKHTRRLFWRLAYRIMYSPCFPPVCVKTGRRAMNRNPEDKNNSYQEESDNIAAAETTYTAGFFGAWCISFRGFFRGRKKESHTNSVVLPSQVERMRTRELNPGEGNVCTIRTDFVHVANVVKGAKHAFSCETTTACCFTTELDNLL